MFAELGRLLTNEALSIGHAMATRLRTREGGPLMGSVSDSQLVDHIPAYIADLGLTLVIVSEVGAEASALLHDGPSWLARVIHDLSDWMEQKGYESLDQLRGSMSQKSLPESLAFVRGNYIRILESYKPTP